MNELIQRIVTGFILGSLFLYAITLGPTFLFPLLLSIAFLLIFFIEWPRLFNYKELLFWALLPYLFIPYCILIMLFFNYRILLVLLFLLISVFDTSSYFGGKIFGNHKIIPSISPGKTYEGFISGLLFTLLSVYAFFSTFCPHKFSYMFINTFTLAFCILALAGDIFESYLKRRVSLKDSGALLPGHGGLLDRLDSLVFTSIFIYILRHSLIQNLFCEHY